MSENVPSYSSLSSIYSEASPRYQSTVQRKLFGCAPDFWVRAPGRVNLIDYSGYAVLPMAIEQDCVVLVKRRTDNNIVYKKFKSKEFKDVSSNIEINNKIHEWSNYFLAGFKGLLENVQNSAPKGFNALVHGIVPMGSGLSSSSALVCASALATMVSINEQLSKKELANLTARSERYIGLEGGGMDQAISFLAEKGKAQLIEFDPLRAFDVNLPDGAMFVIANSLVEANKYVTGTTCYNMRVVECRLGAAVLAKKLGLEKWTEVRKLLHVQQQSNLSLEALVEAVKQHLHEEPYKLSEISRVLELEEETIKSRYLGNVSAESSFELRQRGLHVYSEISRVYQFNEECKKTAYSGQLAALGSLMNESHLSCSSLFKCSCPELDELTSICRKAGALGSRLTGAGWGGCTISLVPAEKLHSFFEQVKEEYYYGVLKMSRDSELDGILFATQPGSGAAIYSP